MSTAPKVNILRSSIGPILADGDFLLVRYQGHIVDEKGLNAAQFDANYDFSSFSNVPSRTPFEFQLGAGSVIQGWEIGLANRRIGEVVELTIPPSLGYGSTPRDKIPANSTLRFRIEIIGGFTSETFTPSLNPEFTFLSLKDLGVDTRRIGLNARDILRASSSTVGLNGSDTLNGKDLAQSGSPQSANRDLLIGLKGNDIVVGGAGGDLLIGGEGRDTFRYKDLDESTLGAMDRIYDLQIGTDRIDGPRAVASLNIKQLGTIKDLTQAGIENVLGGSNSTKGKKFFAANRAATITFGTGGSTRTFLTLNDGTAGFDQRYDGVIEITGYTGALTSLAII